RRDVAGEIVRLEAVVHEASPLAKAPIPAMLGVRLEERDQLEVRAVVEADERVVRADRVPAARRHRESERAIARDGGVQLLHHHDQLVDPMQQRGGRYSTAAAPASPQSWSCWPVPPPQPIAPITLPPRAMGVPPSVGRICPWSTDGTIVQNPPWATRSA